jgi:trk system potassium uptake protein TrkH
MCCFFAILLGMCATGLDLVSAIGASVATLTNAGPGLGTVAYTFADAPPPAVWLGSFAMLLGRLEVFSLLVLFTPAFWRD